MRTIGRKVSSDPCLNDRMTLRDFTLENAADGRAPQKAEGATLFNIDEKYPRLYWVFGSSGR